MYFFMKYLFALFGVTTVIDGERWYSATLTENNKLNFGNSHSHFTPIEKDEYFDNITTIKNQNNSNKYNWHIKNELNYPILQNADSNSSKSDYNGFPFMTNNLDYNQVNVSDLKNFNKIFHGPNKRIIRKEFPKLRSTSRRTNQFTFNDTTKSRFLEVFEVVEFEHVICTSTNGLEGRCLHGYDCQSAGGSPMGTCADGYGICCVIAFSCYGESSAAVTWFTNPGFPLPSTDRISCALTLNKTTPDVQQIRLDFTNFELLPPTAGTCERDQFVVSGQNINTVIPILCGINTGQHLYIEVGNTEGSIHLTIQTIAAESRLFSIKVTQVTKSDDLAAPTGCLQYFNEPQGFIESFNYRNISNVVTTKYPSYLNNLNYAICINREKVSCTVTYTNEDQMQIVNYDTDGLPIIPPRQAGVEIFNCPSDWLLISAIRLCGERLNDGSVLQDFYLNAPVTDTGAGPITIWFRSDEGYVGRGFKLQYQQNPCAIY